jgi:hypothetical protein
MSEIIMPVSKNIFVTVIEYETDSIRNNNEKNSSKDNPVFDVESRQNRTEQNKSSATTQELLCPPH